MDKLRQKQANFLGKHQSKKTFYKELSNIRTEFIKKFPPSRIPHLTIDEYVQGKSISGSVNTDTFCYWVEWGTERLGSIRGATADKFGLYFNNDLGDYRYIKNSCPDNALVNLRIEIKKLIEFGGYGDIEQIKRVALSPMFKGKILFLYYPDRYINILTESWVNYYITVIGLGNTDLDMHLLDKRELIYNFKMSDKIMRNWKMWEFSDFLYSEFSIPAKKGQTPKELRPYIEFNEDYPNINDVSPILIEKTINEKEKELETNNKKISRRKKIIDFIKQDKNLRRIGERGEAIVINQERKYLLKLGRHDLAKKVNQISKEDTSAGYDILSFEPDGRKKYIEVKATISKDDGNIRFYISSNEVKKAGELDNHYIYFVFEVKSKNPKVWPLKNPSKLFDRGITLEPVNFKAEISIELDS